MPIKILLDIGDCFSIPLPDGRLAFGQYVFYHLSHGTLIRVFDKIDNSVVSVDILKQCRMMFPPVFVGLNPPIRMNRWIKIGAFSVDDFVFPDFRFSLTHAKGVNHDWAIWDGVTYHDIGDLPPEYRGLEFKGIYSYGDLEDRILTGKNVFWDGVE